MRRNLPRCGIVALIVIAALAAVVAPMQAATSDRAASPTDEPATLTAPDALAMLPPYLPKAPVAGELVVAGSSAMNHMARMWADGLQQLHADADITINMFESGKVLPELAANKMAIGLMSRPLTESELSSGNILAFAVAKDVLGIAVHPDNPLETLTIEQGLQILRDPEAADQPGAKTWGELGLEGEWTDVPITLYGRTGGAGAWGYLVNTFLGEGLASRTAAPCSGYAEICTSVSEDRGGIGYVSLSLAPPNKGKMLPLTLTSTGEVIAPPAPGEQVDPRYPLVRDLYVVIRWQEGQQLAPLVREFVDYVLSRSGQEDAVKAGFLPLRRDEVLAIRDQLGWTGKR